MGIRTNHFFTTRGRAVNKREGLLQSRFSRTLGIMEEEEVFIHPCGEPILKSISCTVAVLPFGFRNVLYYSEDEEGWGRKNAERHTQRYSTLGGLARHHGLKCARPSQSESSTPSISWVRLRVSSNCCLCARGVRGECRPRCSILAVPDFIYE